MIVGCSDSGPSSPFGPINPSDPLLGVWESTNVTGQTRFWTSLRWTFGSDGSYQLVQPRVALTEIVSEVEEGWWERIDDTTIRRCRSLQTSSEISCDEPFESAIRLEVGGTLDRMLIDGQIALNGEWGCNGLGACMSHGTYKATDWQVMLHPDGTAKESLYTCSNLTGFPGRTECNGTWTETPSLLEITFTEPWCDPLRCPRIGDMAAGHEYRRVQN